MNARGLGLTLAAVVLVGSLASTPLLGYAFIFPDRRWFPEDLPREIWVDPRGHVSVNDPDRGVTAVMSRMEAWEEAGALGNLLRPIEGTPGDPDGVPAFSGADGISTLRFDDPATICTGSCLAATTAGGIDLFQSGDCNGRTWFRWIDADVVYNANYAWTTEAETDAEGGCSGEFYLEGVGLHEIGHLLAMGHTGDGSAVMYASVGACNRNKTRLKPDDLAGIRVPYECAFSQGGVFADSDGDGAGQDQDCDDQDPQVFPGAPEVCDLRDTDCDGLGDADEGLDCDELCLSTSAGLGEVMVEKGACAGEPVPGQRQVYSRGFLDDLIAAGAVGDVEVFACPSYTIYDRVNESSAAGPGQSRYYLVREDADTDYGKESDGTPRTPAENGCP